MRKELNVIEGNYLIGLNDFLKVRLEEIRLPHKALERMPYPMIDKVKENIKQFIIETKKEGNKYLIKSFVWYDDIESRDYVLKIEYFDRMDPVNEKTNQIEKD